MFPDNESAVLGDFALAFFDFRIVELFDAAALYAYQVIVMAFGVKFEHRLA